MNISKQCTLEKKNDFRMKMRNTFLTVQTGHKKNMILVKRSLNKTRT